MTHWRRALPKWAVEGGKSAKLELTADADLTAISASACLLLSRRMMP